MSSVADIMDPLGSSQPTTSSNPAESDLQPGEVGLLDISGKPVAAPSHLVPSLLQSGYMQDTPENRTNAALWAKYGDAPFLAGAAGAARGATFGLSDQILTKTGAVDPSTLKALDEYNPIASTVGNVAGTVGSALLAPGFSPVGLVGKAGVGAAEALGGGVAAKLAGSAIEGAFYGLGQTATEQALGDPDLTAQKVVANVGLGALLGMGGSAVFQGIAGFGRKIGGTERSLGKVNNYLLGTPEADTAYYMANQEHVNAAPEMGTIKDVIDDHVAGVQQTAEQSKAAYDNALAAVKSMQPDNALASDLHAAMEGQKTILGQRGAELEQALEQSGLQVPAADVVQAINTQRNALQVGKSVFGASNKAVAGYLDGLAQQAEALPEILDGAQLRQIVRALREDGAAAYGLSAGEFSEGKAKAASSIAESLNQHIRNVTEAAAILDDMRGRMQALDGMQQYFGSADKALTSLQAAAGDSAKNELRLKALQQFDQATGSNFVGRIKPYQDARIVLDQIKQGIPTSTAVASIPTSSAELTALGQAAIAHEANSAAWDNVKRLSAGRSQGIVESYMTKTAKSGETGLPPKFSLEDAKALDHLASLQQTDARLNGRTIYEAMRDRGVLDRFSTSKANGSRNAFIFGSLGAGAGGLLGGKTGALVGENLGSLVGGMVDKSGGLAAKRIMDGVLMAQKAGNKGVTTQLGQFMLNKLGPAAIAGMKASTISEILQHLQRQSAFDPREEQRTRSLGQLERHSNQTTSRLERGVQRFFEGGEVEARPEYEGDTHEAMEDVRKLAGNPEALLDRVHTQTAALADMAPKVTQGVNDTAIRAVQFLNSKLPPSGNNLTLDGEAPFSASHITHFKTALDTVNDPLSVLQHAKEGTLSSAHLEALNAVYPHLAAELKSHALNKLAEQEAPKLPFSKKTALSRLVGTPLVRQLLPNEMAASQAQTSTQVAQEQQQGAVRPSQKGLSKLSLGTRYQTDFQQVAARRNA